jgi:hypothetical protein
MSPRSSQSPESPGFPRTSMTPDLRSDPMNMQMPSATTVSKLQGIFSAHGLVSNDTVTRWTINVARGDTYSRASDVLSTSGLDQYMATRVHGENATTDYTIKYTGGEESVHMMVFAIASEFAGSQNAFARKNSGGGEKNRECVVPPSVCQDPFAIACFIFYMYTGILVDVFGCSREQIVLKTGSYRMNTGRVDLFDVYKLSKFLEVTKLSDLLLEHAVMIFGDTPRNVVQEQFAYLLMVSQSHADVDVTELHEKVMQCLTTTYIGVPVLMFRPLDFYRGTWDELIRRNARYSFLFGSVLSMYHFVWETRDSSIYGTFDDSIHSTEWKDKKLSVFYPLCTKLERVPTFRCEHTALVEAVIRAYYPTGEYKIIRPFLSDIGFLWSFLKDYCGSYTKLAVTPTWAKKFIMKLVGLCESNWFTPNTGMSLNDFIVCTANSKDSEEENPLWIAIKSSILWTISQEVWKTSTILSIKVFHSYCFAHSSHSMDTIKVFHFFVLLTLWMMTKP